MRLLYEPQLSTAVSVSQNEVRTPVCGYSQDFCIFIDGTLIVGERFAPHYLVIGVLWNYATEAVRQN